MLLKVSESALTRPDGHHRMALSSIIFIIRKLCLTNEITVSLTDVILGYLSDSSED